MTEWSCLDGHSVVFSANTEAYSQSERDTHAFVNECVCVWMSGWLLPFEYSMSYGYGVAHLSALHSSAYGK